MGSIMEIKDWWPKQSCDTVSLNDLPCWHISVADGQYMYSIYCISPAPGCLRTAGMLRLVNCQRRRQKLHPPHHPASRVGRETSFANKFSTYLGFTPSKEALTFFIFWRIFSSLFLREI